MKANTRNTFANLTSFANGVGIQNVIYFGQKMWTSSSVKDSL